MSRASQYHAAGHKKRKEDQRSSFQRQGQCALQGYMSIPSIAFLATTLRRTLRRTLRFARRTLRFTLRTTRRTLRFVRRTLRLTLRLALALVFLLAFLLAAMMVPSFRWPATVCRRLIWYQQLLSSRTGQFRVNTNLTDWLLG